MFVSNLIIFMDILEISDQYKTKADNFLQTSKLLSVLKKYGRVKYEGAYSGNVMLDGDIDMRVIRDTDYSMDDIFTIMKDVYGTCADEFRAFYLKTDWSDPRIGAEFPHGKYVGFKMNIDGELWKIDTWFVSEDEHVRDRGVLNIGDVKLTEEQRKLILEFKKYRKETGKKMSGQQIYEAVLEQGMTKPEQLFQ